mgnify:CR=1 FL=1
MNVIVHREPTRAIGMSLGVVPAQINASKFFACPVFAHFIVFIEYAQEVVGMLFADIFNAKVINYENELDRTP